jgi:hypothetical protein
MRFETTIASFAAALGDPAAPPPAATRGRRDAPDVRRFAVYRNNVAVGLIAALEARFPVTRRILGAESFRAIARAYAQTRKPRSPILIAYGDDFPAHLETLGVERGVAELARLENAWVEAYHAAEAPAVVLDDLARLDPAALADMRVTLHPATRLLAFATPAGSLWAAHQEGAEPLDRPTPQAEDALIARPHADVTVRILPPSGYAFATRLRDGATLAEAAEALADPSMFGAHIVGLVTAGAIASIASGDPS